MIFQHKEMLPLQIYYQIKHAYEGLWKQHTYKSPRVVTSPNIEKSNP
jgi:hypothetical protein